ncbi:IS481 family transposase [Arthrobacter sp. ISL-85]|uniref:IS481 family transposase n=1 Tax=Arthrobacter sp. ISL-85 TaxID=2819115 RepID=UPI001BE880E2|nr:IS481 family transposase [Arthrobacter sp. ISL-85]MBT2567333.1 IS481 family transposase [Arthrobacter sp. ISL-85]
MSHANALLTPKGRLRLARCIVEDGWSLRRAAERFQVSVTTAARWAARYRAHGEAGMNDRSSRPVRSPGRTSVRRERRIIAVRVNRRWGPARIGFLLGIHPSTVHRVLSRFGLARLSWLDRATGRVIRRYEHHSPGELVHVDIKKLGRIPDGGGHRVTGRAKGNRNKTGTAVNRWPGYAFLHNAVDDHSRLAYTEILCDEKKDTAAGFWERANAFFESHGVTVKRVLTDNGSCYRSHAFKDALGPAIKHKRTRPYRPQTNGKVERYNRTMLDGAYARPYRSEAERVAAFADWLHHYNHHRGHTSLKGQPPASRVTNLTGQYT